MAFPIALPLAVGGGFVGYLIVGNRRQQQEMIRAIDANGLKPIVDTTFAMADLADAFRHEEGNKHFGKICVSI